MQEEQIIMQLISMGGDARASSIKAIQCARKGDFEQSEELLKSAKISLTNAHNSQTKLIQKEINGDTTKVTLLMVHAQDHLMNAITVNELAKEFIEYMKKEGVENDL